MMIKTIGNDDDASEIYDDKEIKNIMCLGSKAARTASSKTSFTPSPVRAEHSVYAFALDCLLSDLGGGVEDAIAPKKV